jgi:hypothetical protein
MSLSTSLYQSSAMDMLGPNNSGKKSSELRASDTPGNLPRLKIGGATFLSSGKHSASELGSLIDDSLVSCSKRLASGGTRQSQPAWCIPHLHCNLHPHRFVTRTALRRRCSFSDRCARAADRHFSCIASILTPTMEVRSPILKGETEVTNSVQTD